MYNFTIIVKTCRNFCSTIFLDFVEYLDFFTARAADFRVSA